MDRVKPLAGEPTIACVRGGGVVDMIRSTLEHAQTLGYDDVGVPTRVGANNWRVNGTVYPDRTESTESATSRDMEQQAENALDSLRAYIANGSPTNAQTIAVIKVICRVCVFLIRWKLGRLEAST